MVDETPRKWTSETGQPRLDKDGVGWYACDPYPTWYRWENGKLITRDWGCIYSNPLVHQHDENCEFPTEWVDE